MCDINQSTINTIVYLRDNKLPRELCSRLAGSSDLDDDVTAIPVMSSGKQIGVFEKAQNDVFSYRDFG